MVTGSTNVSIIQLTLFNIAGPGTYPLGVTPTIFGGVGMITRSSGTSATVYSTPNSGSAGTITITTLTATRIAATFSFTASRFIGSTGPLTTTVTNGQFDLTLASGGALEAVPANAGSRATCSFGGSAWTAGTVVALNSSGNVTLGLANDDYQINIFLIGVTGPGTYAITPSNFNYVVTAVHGTGTNPNPNCCWTFGTGVSGSVTISTLNADRGTGTFDVTLPPDPATVATSPLTLSGGVFDVGFFH